MPLGSRDPKGVNAQWEDCCQEGCHYLATPAEDTKYVPRCAKTLGINNPSASFALHCIISLALEERREKFDVNPALISAPFFSLPAPIDRNLGLSGWLGGVEEGNQEEGEKVRCGIFFWERTHARKRH